MAASTNHRVVGCVEHAECSIDKQKDVQSSDNGYLNEGDCLTTNRSSKQLLYSEKFPEHSMSRFKIIDEKGKKREKQDGVQTYRIPPSSVLNQVKNFLPEIRTSNVDLDRRLKDGCPSEVDIENIESCQGPHIEMSLSLVEMGSDTDSDSDSISDIDSENSAENCCLSQEVTEDNIKLFNTDLVKQNISSDCLVQVLDRAEDDSRDVTLNGLNDSQAACGLAEKPDGHTK